MTWDLLDLFTEFMPHRHCFESRLHIMLIYIIGHGGVALAYLFGFKAALVATLEANGLVLNGEGAKKLGRFVWWCGLGHASFIVTLWWGYYTVGGLIALVTAYVSWDFILSVREGTEKAVDVGAS